MAFLLAPGGPGHTVWQRQLTRDMFITYPDVRPSSSHWKKSSSAVASNELPNFVFMLADDLGYGDLHYTGSPAETPNLDAMATGPNSIQLTRYYAGAPVCSPTRGTVLTGRNHNRYCMWRANIGRGHDFADPMLMPLPPTEISVATILQQSGYQTGIFGKWHIGDLKNTSTNGKEHHKKWPVSHPGMHGFDKWWVTERSAPTANVNCWCFEDQTQCITGHYEVPRLPCSNYHTVDKHTDTLRSYNDLIAGDDSHFIANQFEQFLQESSGKPFFAYLPFHTAHQRFIATKEYASYYTDQGMSLEQADYFGSITAMDDAVGLIRQALRKNNVSDNTMLWFTSDNGPEDHTPGRTGGLRGRKRALYEGGIRVPGIIEWPAVIKRNRVSDFPVVSSDFLPTVCNILGLEPPNDRPLDGISVWPFIREQTSTRNKSIAWAYQISKGRFTDKQYQAALSNDRFKVHAIYSSNSISKAELYDLKHDRGEKNNLAARFPGILNSMKQELEEWRQSVIRSARDEVQCLEID